MEAETHPAAWKTLLAFAIIYFVWGSTFLAIRVGVREVPPFILAAMRFLAAGLVLYGWMLARGERSPSSREWTSAFLLAILIFLIDYGLLFWAEQRVPSGLAAVMMATIPVFMSLSEIVFLRTQRLTRRLAFALVIGIGGVAGAGESFVEPGRSASIDTAGAVALIVGSISFAISSTLARKLTLPPSKVMSSGAQMLAGGVLLALAGVMLGEFLYFPPAGRLARSAVAPLYLTPAPSWGLDCLRADSIESPTGAGTYAYVNPVVAVLVGYFLGGETLGLRTMLGTALVLVSVVVITTTRRVPAVTGART